MALVNAVNMTDGLDGLAGSLALVPILGFIAASVLFGNSEETLVLIGLAASIFAFLVFNITVPGKRRALIFLGDSGSMFLGLVLAWFAIRLSQGEDRVITPAAALWFLTLPIYDTVCMASRRVIRKRPMFSADKEHLHHRVLAVIKHFVPSTNLSIRLAVLVMYGLAVIFAALGYALVFVSWRYVLAVFLAVFGFIAVGAYKSGRRQAFLERNRDPLAAADPDDPPGPR